MAAKPTYEELELRTEKLERKVFGRKLSEEALQAPAGFLDTLVSSISDGVIVYDDKFRYKLWNKFMENLTGIRAENVLGKIAFDLFPHLREEGIDKLLERALAGETVKSDDTSYHVPDTGKVGWVTGLYSPHVDPSGNIIGVVAIVHDISDRKRAENMLRESEERHRLLLEVSPDPIVLYDIEGKTSYVNPAFEQTFGWTLDELREKRINFVPEENWPETKEAINRMLQGLKIQLFETRRLTKDGRILDIQLSSSLFFDQDEKPKGNIVILRDITAQKRAEETLRKAHDKLEQNVKARTTELVLANENLQQEIADRQHADSELVKSKAMFKAIVESLPFDVFVLDIDNRYILQNATCKKNWGDLIGKSPEDLPVNKETSNLWKENNRLALSGETVTGEVVYDRLDGGKNFYYNIIAPICDGKKILGIVGVLVDISSRKYAEEALRESESKLSTMLESIGDHMSMMDKDLNIIWANEIAMKIFGNIIIGKKCYEVYHKGTEPCEPYPCITLRAFQDGKIHEHDTQVIDKDGKTVFFHCTANVALKDKEGKPTAVLEISRDITENVRAENALQKAKDELENRVEERTRELEIQKSNLEEANIALQVLLEKRQEDKKEIADNVLINMKELVAPYFEKIKKTKLDDQQKVILSIIGYNLNEIVSPFTRKMSQKYLNLTPTEIEVTNLIRYGSDSKEISELMGLSPRTIYNHRKNIRKKFGLDNKKTNLRSHLLSIY